MNRPKSTANLFQFPAKKIDPNNSGTLSGTKVWGDDYKGVVLSKNLSGSPLAQSMFRILFTKSTIKKDIWKLKIENPSGVEQIFIGYS